MSETEKLHAGVARIAAFGITTNTIGLVLGSGLRDFASAVEGAREIGFGEVPHWPVPAVAGHAGSLVVGEVEGAHVACLTGRVHLYEGWSASEVVRAVRCLRLAGAERFLLTNAAGGVDRAFRPGDLMIVRDHLDRTGTSCLLGPEEPALGPRFPDQSEIYSRELGDLLLRCDPDLREGVYAGNLGPGYETPAEIRMLAAAGVHAVGMSTVQEAAALNAMGARIAAVSLISNQAAGISPTPLDHDEVLAAGRAAAGRLTVLVRAFCRALAKGRA